VLQDGSFQRVGGTKEMHVDVRILSATHVDLAEAIAEKKFRDDLYYRLNVMNLSIAPLRERREDIPLLANYFLAKHATRLRTNVSVITPRAMEELLVYQWPGNVRELENAVQRAIGMAADEQILSFQLTMTQASSRSLAPLDSAMIIPFGTTLAEIEERAIQETLRYCGGAKAKAAKLLGVSRRTIERRFSSQEPPGQP
jgi:two-component system response regulator HydG